MNWNEYHLGFAEHAALKSKDSTKVGAVIVGPLNEIRATGFNGPPIGVHESEARRERPTKYLFASHAEANAIAFAARNGVPLAGCSIYVTHPPCAACTRSIIQAGIKKVFIGKGELSAAGGWEADILASREMMAEAGVRVVCLPCDEQPELPLG
jgi:dCMP deaminase